MASPGYHKHLISTHSKLEVKRAGKAFECAGVAVERGARPGPLQDVWMWGRSRRCMTKIRQGQLYIGNGLLPPAIKSNLGWDAWLPLCVHCAMDAYSEYFEGPKKIEFMRPLSPEKRQRAVEGLAAVLEDVRCLSEKLGTEAA